MKAALKISIVLNLLLLGSAVYLAVQREKVVTASTPISESPTVSSNVSQVETKPFRWSQIESPDYPTYIKNLRGIGCPEQTIRDLIVADVSQLYASRAEHLKQDQSLFKDALDAQLRALDDEKAKVIAYLLGDKTDARSIADSENRGAESNSVSLPLVWQKVDLAKLNLEPSQLEAIVELRQAFSARFANLDPNSPAYLEQWKKAQPEMDDVLAGNIGRKDFLEYESLAGNGSVQPAQ